MKLSTTASAPASTLGRAIQLLKLVAYNRSQPLRMVDLAELAGLDRSTAHRLLQRLVSEGMLVRNEKGSGYRLGPLPYELGLGVFPENNLRQIAHPALLQLAQETGDMAFLIGRSGFETVCLDRVAGNFAIQTLVGGVGDRHPMGVGAGGPAILSVLNDNDRDVVYRAVSPQLARYGLSVDILKDRVARVCERGYALDDGVTVKDVTVLARPIVNSFGTPVGAVFIASIKSRMTSERRSEVDKQLALCVAQISAAS